MNHARLLLSREGAAGGYKLQFDFSKSTRTGPGRAGGRGERAVGLGTGAARRKKKKRRKSQPAFGAPSASAGYQLAIRALIAFECNVAENFI